MIQNESPVRPDGAHQVHRQTVSAAARAHQQSPPRRTTPRYYENVVFKLVWNIGHGFDRDDARVRLDRVLPLQPSPDFLCQCPQSCHVMSIRGLTSPRPNSRCVPQMLQSGNGGVLFVFNCPTSIKCRISVEARSAPMNPVRRWTSSVTALAAIVVVNGMTAGATPSSSGIYCCRRSSAASAGLADCIDSAATPTDVIRPRQNRHAAPGASSQAGTPSTSDGHHDASGEGQQ